MEVANLILDYIRALIWPAVVVAVCLLFRPELIALLRRIRHAKLPGGVVVDLEEEIRDVKVLSRKVQEEPRPEDGRRGPLIPLTEANTRLMQLGLRPSPSGLDMRYYRNLADQDPNVALAGLRIEIDVLSKNLAKGFNVEVDERAAGARLLRLLYEAEAITSDQMQLAMKVLNVCNAAAHGSPISRAEAEDVISSAEVLANQYLAWLSWGFDDGWAPKSGKRIG